MKIEKSLKRATRTDKKVSNIPKLSWGYENITGTSKNI